MLTELQWNDLIRSLENEKCILILGTETLVDVQGKAILPQFLDDVGYPNSPQIRFFDNDFFFYKDEISKRLINGELQDFLKKQSSPPYFDDLAKIPFHLILNLNPDLRLRSSFENQGFELVFDHYHKNKPCAPLDEKPNKNKPLSDIDSYRKGSLSLYMPAKYSTTGQKEHIVSFKIAQIIDNVLKENPDALQLFQF